MITERMPTSMDKMRVTGELAFKTIFYSKKWIMYTIIALIPLFYTLFVEDKLLGAVDGSEAFIGIVLVQFYIFFTFGCLFLALPVSSDEISDNVIDLYIIRPVRRELIYISRWIVLMISIILVNFLIATIYYTYYQFMDPNVDGVSGIIDNINMLFYALVLIIAFSLIYGSMFLFIGFIGEHGFTLGVLAAIFELFITGFLFLNDNPYMPRTNLQVIASELFPDKYFEYTVSGVPDLFTSILYVIVSTVLFVAVGVYYFQNKEIN
ncbi:MAG: hypothetical protein ACXAC7_02680 [Candidatus Hodarchaeales archaeon]|jgi:ABC-type transport system involved in multi-copper enzyme maturation permease subunit